jgi:uncharacterized protein with PIN domain
VNHASSPASLARPKFLADEMLGRLAKWLRLLGYDTAYVSGIADRDLVSLAEAEDRIILTRDTSLILRKRCRRYIFVRSDHWREQLEQVYREAGLNCESMLTLCALCNSRLQQVEKASVETRVPPYVYHTQESFYECKNCARLFWPATHVSRILEELSSIREES